MDKALGMPAYSGTLILTQCIFFGVCTSSSGENENVSWHICSRRRATQYTNIFFGGCTCIGDQRG